LTDRHKNRQTDRQTNRQTMNLFLLSLVLIAATTTFSVVAPQKQSSSYPTIQTAHLKKVFAQAKPYSDLTNAFYSIKGLQLLGDDSLKQLSKDDQLELCTFVKSKVDKTSLESIHYATSLASLLATTTTKCELPVADFAPLLKETLTGTGKGKGGATLVSSLYHYSRIVHNLPKQQSTTAADQKSLSNRLLEALKKDSSILNQAYALHIAASSLASAGAGAGAEAKRFFAGVEDLLDQADEVDKRFVQYEGGVGTTALVLEGIFELSERVGAPKLSAKLSHAKLAKFVAYMTSKRQPVNIKSAYFLLRACLKLSDNKYAIPLVLNRASPISQTEPIIVTVTDILGRPTTGKKFTLNADSVHSHSGGSEPAIITKKTPFTSRSSDSSSVFMLTPSVSAKQTLADFYTLKVSLQQPAQQAGVLFLCSTQFDVKVSAQVELAALRFGVGNRARAEPKLDEFTVGSAAKQLAADQQTKLVIKFGIKETNSDSKDSRQKLRDAHQTFVRFVSSASASDIVFLAEQSTRTDEYQAEIDFTSEAGNFKHKSGAYSLELVVSDALIANPVHTKIADIQLRFDSNSDLDETTQEQEHQKRKTGSLLPEIKHTFREPEQMPSTLVSSVFTVLVLLPLVLLLALWSHIGFNLNKLGQAAGGLSTLVFHATLAAIFGLFYCYWTKLNMFATMKYLTLLGVVAVFSGNKVLKALAASSSSSSNEKAKKNN